MSVEYRSGDVFNQHDVEALGHGVNCKGVMGAGIAVLFKSRWEEMFKEYRTACWDGDLQLGDVLPWYDGDSGLWVYNLATQYNPGRNAVLEAVRQSVSKMLDHMEENNVASVALPQIGCGIGGLKWDEVSSVIEELASDRLEKVVLVEYSP